MSKNAISRNTEADLSSDNFNQVSRKDVIFVPNRQVLKRIFIGGLSWSLNEYDLKEFFSQFGCVVSSQILRDVNGYSRGFGFVSFGDYDNPIEKENFLNIYNNLLKNKYVLINNRRTEIKEAFKETNPNSHNENIQIEQQKYFKPSSQNNLLNNGKNISISFKEQTNELNPNIAAKPVIVKQCQNINDEYANNSISQRKDSDLLQYVEAQKNGFTDYSLYQFQQNQQQQLAFAYPNTFYDRPNFYVPTQNPVLTNSFNYPQSYYWPPNNLVTNKIPNDSNIIMGTSNSYNPFINNNEINMQSGFFNCGPLMPPYGNPFPMQPMKAPINKISNNDSPMAVFAKMLRLHNTQNNIDKQQQQPLENLGQDPLGFNKMENADNINLDLFNSNNIDSGLLELLNMNNTDSTELQSNFAPKPFVENKNKTKNS